MFLNLINIFAILESYINTIFTSNFNDFIIIYLDDIFISVKNKEKPYLSHMLY